jgi:membrane protein DedA with SNARE-associated domain
MLKWIVHLVSSMSYLGVGILMAIENIVLPIPSELIMPLAGFQTAHGRMKIVRVILAGTIGSVAGSLPLYYAGCALGEDRLRKWVEKYGRWMMLRGRDLERATKRFSGNAFLAVFVGQLIPGVRGLISLPAGVAKMNVGLFLAANFAGTILWCAVLAVAGRLLGSNFTKIHKFLGPVGWSILAVLLLTAIGWIFWRRHKRAAANS